MLSIDASAVVWLCVIAALLTSPAIIKGPDRVDLNVASVCVVLATSLVCFVEVDMIRAAICVLVFCCVSALMSVVYTELVQHTHGFGFWPKLYVVDVGILNGIILWAIIRV